VRERADAELDEEPVESEELVLVEDLRGDLVRRCPTGSPRGDPARLEPLAAGRRPAALPPIFAIT